MNHSTSIALCWLALGAALGCSSGASGGGALPCDDGGACPDNMVCGAQGYCESGGSGGNNSGGFGFGGVGASAGSSGAGSGGLAGAAGGGGAAGSPPMGGFGGAAGFGGVAGGFGGGPSGGFGGTGATGGFGGTGGGPPVGGAGGTGGAGGGGLPVGCVLPSVTLQCNPLTNASCTAGYACDLAPSTSTFLCFEPPNNAQPNQSCSNASTGPYCIGGYRCTGEPGVCKKYCCSSADCGGGTCTPLSGGQYGTIGYCP